ncbi:hypothetical protein [Pandoraea sp. NPDC090278]|uniref:hypothetical protein n=1 Tax=Pandoraea sp. NPDC090278 TaxID=3364391 RepID=UPI00383A70F3
MLPSQSLWTAVGVSSLGAQVSTLLPGITVKAYEGSVVVRGSLMPQFYHLFNNGHAEFLETVCLPDVESVKDSMHYHAVSYRDGKVVKEHFNGVADTD